ncbi:Gfo/Idh/MocA family protein [Sulfobacillus harzensis]|uniref:Gfo/Idh/MocA family oxidoreductase n=1 Tax=Sulfobacillus harzensis TaxID=2729629 RepID=A0A7Y0L434_9FIRM|nr:Gfo/Idh/MocA family oxidoreductase [Sulfobacillus harzensis]NMP22708.1 Gfo/Idh/MocA family oxidoreductase [Sulfobacillus harzensis]
MVRWGILGSGWVVQNSFGPAMKSLSSGTIGMIGSRLGSRNGLARDLQVRAGTYEDVLDDSTIDAVYIALPNHLHEEWTVKALAAGKHVLAEKPLGLDAESVARMIESARAHNRYLWEAFAFPFREQMRMVQEILDEGAIGAVCHLQSVFYSSIADPNNIRWDATMGGGALYDVGCYPVHWAGYLLGEAHQARAFMVERRGVDVEVNGQVAFAGGTTLQFLAGLNRPYETSGQVLGTRGRLVLTNPYHPTPGDTIRVITPEGTREWAAAQGDMTFVRMVEQINATIMGDQPPRHLAAESALRTAQTLALLRQSSAVIHRI